MVIFTERLINFFDVMKLTDLLTQWFAHPLTRGMDIDQPQTTALRQQIISSKPFLENLYEEWSLRIAVRFPPNARVLELGSGLGYVPSVSLYQSELVVILVMLSPFRYFVTFRFSAIHV